MSCQTIGNSDFFCIFIPFEKYMLIMLTTTMTMMRMELYPNTDICWRGSLLAEVVHRTTRTAAGRVHAQPPEHHFS